MIWLLVGLVSGATIGALLMAAASIHRHRDTQAVADAAVWWIADGEEDSFQNLTEAVDRLMAE